MAGKTHSASAFTLTLNGSTYSCAMEEYVRLPGSTPSRAIVNAYGFTFRNFDYTTADCKTAVVKQGSTNIITGYCLGTIGRFSSRSDSVRLKIIDLRDKLNSDYVGRTQLGASGLKVLGADVTFNMYGRPNKDIDTGIYLDTPVAPDFVYNRADAVDPADDVLTDADYWTYGDVIHYLFNTYLVANGFTNPIDIGGTVQDWGGLDQPCEEMNLFTMPFGAALDLICSKIAVQWSMDGDGDVYLFARSDPRASASWNIPPSSGTVAASATDLTYPVELEIDRDWQSVVDSVDIIGGPAMREIMAQGKVHVIDYLNDPPGAPHQTGDAYLVNTSPTGDWTGKANQIASWASYDPENGLWGFRIPNIGDVIIVDSTGQAYEWDGDAWNTTTATEDFVSSEFWSIEPNPAPPDTLFTLGSITIVPDWRNTQVVFNRRLLFSHSSYESHSAGKNIRRKDKAKSITTDLLIGRDRYGKFANIQTLVGTNVENEAVIEPVDMREGLSTLMAAGFQINPDCAAIDYLSAYPSTDPYLGFARWTHVIQTEVREYVNLAATNATLPYRKRRAVVRNEYVHKTREAVKISFPVKLTIILSGTDIQWEALPLVDVPDGGTLDYPLTFSGPIGDPGSHPPYDFTMTLDAGTVVDGVAPLNVLKSIVELEVGRVVVNVTGLLPAFSDIEIGTKITWAQSGTVGNPCGLTSEEVIMACHFDGLRQRMTFAATNYINPDALRLAQAFVNTRPFVRAGV